MLYVLCTQSTTSKCPVFFSIWRWWWLRYFTVKRDTFNWTGSCTMLIRVDYQTVFSFCSLTNKSYRPKVNLWQLYLDLLTISLNKIERFWTIRRELKENKLDSWVFTYAVVDNIHVGDRLETFPRLKSKSTDLWSNLSELKIKQVSKLLRFWFSETSGYEQNVCRTNISLNRSSN